MCWQCEVGGNRPIKANVCLEKIYVPPQSITIILSPLSVVKTRAKLITVSVPQGGWVEAGNEAGKTE